MTPEEHVAAVDERLRKLEGLVKLSLCRCVVGMTSYSSVGCPLHGPFVMFDEIVRDRQQWLKDAA